MRSFWIFWEGAKSNDKCPYKRQKRRQRESLEKCGYKPRNAWSCQKLEEARKDSPPEPSEGVQPCGDTLILDV